MIVKTKLARIQEVVAPQVERAEIRGQGAASFIYATNRGRAVEISEHNGGFWLEFWAEGDDYGSPTKEMTVESADDAIQNALRWLRGA